jgi:hypothetical protein
MLEFAADLTAAGECGSGPVDFLRNSLGADDSLDDQGEPIYDWLSWDTPRVSKWREKTTTRSILRSWLCSKKSCRSFGTKTGTWEEGCCAAWKCGSAKLESDFLPNVNPCICAGEVASARTL